MEKQITTTENQTTLTDVMNLNEVCNWLNNKGYNDLADIIKDKDKFNKDRWVKDGMMRKNLIKNIFERAFDGTTTFRQLECDVTTSFMETENQIELLKTGYQTTLKYTNYQPWSGRSYYGGVSGVKAIQKLITVEIGRITEKAVEFITLTGYAWVPKKCLIQQNGQLEVKRGFCYTGGFKFKAKNNQNL